MGRAKRFVVFFECNGVNMQRVFPATPFGALTDASYAGDRTLSPIARVFCMEPDGM